MSTSKFDRRGYALIDKITNQSVIDAVDAMFKQHRPYSEHWNYYMNHEQRMSFSDNCAAFIEACRARRTWLTH